MREEFITLPMWSHSFLLMTYTCYWK